MIGVAPTQVPAAPVNVEPTDAVPVIVGIADAVGAADPTAAVSAELAEAVPATFVAVTVTRRWNDASAATTRYVALVAPATSVHEPPAEAQRDHW